jgi:hypothetical protein
MAPKNGSSNGRKMTKHHILPRSRGGNGNGEKCNIIRIPQRLHESWHVLFGNMTIEETMEFIEIVFQGRGLRKIKKSWTGNDLYELQLNLQKETLSKEKEEKRKKKK